MLLPRVITALFLLVVFVVVAVATPPFVFALVIALITILAGMEWTRFIGLSNLRERSAYTASILVFLIGAFYLLDIGPQTEVLEPIRVITLLALGCVFWILAALLMGGFPANHKSWNDPSKIALMGIFVLIPTWCGIVQLKYLDQSGRLLLAIIAIVSVADIGAYFAGRAWGQSKLAPSLSPAKSWAGFWGGMAASVATSLLLLVLIGSGGISLGLVAQILVVFGAVLVFVSSVIGDLFESMLKRNQDLKDSGNVLPGHGGILDRLDSLTAATPVAVLWVFLIIGTGGVV